MIDWLTSQGFAVTLSRGLVLLERRGLTYDYPSVRAAYEAQGGSKSNIYAYNGKA